MKYTTTDTESAVILEPATKASAAVIWLHGLGADGHDFVPIVDELKLPDTLGVRFVFPHATPRPVTINNGYVMRAWYDIKGLQRGGEEDDAGIRDSQAIVRKYMETESAKGIAASRIVLAGFSQGGAIALQTALRHHEPLAGVMALSTYLPLHASLAREASSSNRAIPILMCHGTQDSVVPLQMGEHSRALLEQHGYRVEWHTYPMPHSVCIEEVNDISRWLQARFN